jgi:hypothetical protein
MSGAADGAAVPAASAAPEDGDADIGVAAVAARAVPKVSVAELLAKDAGDASLARYKAQLLGGVGGVGGAGAGASPPPPPPPDPLGRPLIILDMRIEVAGRDDIVIPLAMPEDVAAASAVRVGGGREAAHARCRCVTAASWRFGQGTAQAWWFTWLP